MIMKSYYLLIFSSLILFSCGKPSVNIPDEKKLLLKTDSEFAKASVKLGSAEAFRKYLTDEAVHFPSGADPVKGNNAIYKLMLKNEVKYQLDWEPKEADIALSGDFGYTWGTYKLTHKDKNDSLHTEKGHYVNVWRKDNNGNWKVLIDIGN